MAGIRAGKSSISILFLMLVLIIPLVLMSMIIDKT